MGPALSCRHYTQKFFKSFVKPKGKSHSRGTLKNVITCHDGPQEQKGTKKEISCLCPKVIHDLPLADGEGNTKNLQTNKGSIKLYCYYKAAQRISQLTKVSEHTCQPSCWPSEAKVVTNTPNGTPLQLMGRQVTLNAGIPSLTAVELEPRLSGTMLEETRMTGILMHFPKQKQNGYH